MDKNIQTINISSNKETISCSGLDAKSKHPKVYLNLLPEKKKNCPYCGVVYLYQE